VRVREGPRRSAKGPQRVREGFAKVREGPRRSAKVREGPRRSAKFREVPRRSAKVREGPCVTLTFMESNHLFEHSSPASQGKIRSKTSKNHTLHTSRGAALIQCQIYSSAFSKEDNKKTVWDLLWHERFISQNVVAAKMYIGIVNILYIICCTLNSGTHRNLDKF
jgi:hypothetical protein